MKITKIIKVVSLLSLCTLAMWAALALDYIAPWTESIVLTLSLLTFGGILLYIFDEPHTESHTESHILGWSIWAFGWVHMAHTIAFDKRPVFDWFSFLPEIPYWTEIKILVAAIFSFLSMIFAWANILFPDKPRDEEEPKPKKPPKRR